WHNTSDVGSNNKIQAEKAADCIDYAGQKPELGVYGDWESDYKGLTIQQMRDAIWKYILRFENLTGMRLDAYTRKYWWDEQVASSTHGSTDIPRDRKLWTANFRTSPPPLLPWDWEQRYGENCWLFWQYNNVAKIPGCPGRVDFNTFNGSRADYFDYFDLDETPAPPPIPEPPPEPPEETDRLQFEVMQDGLRVRSTPEALTDGSNIIGSLPAGQIVEVHDIGGNSAWVEIAPGQWSNVEYYGDKNMKVNNG
ncbi:unnamed protein product, partial [marine sediment metagenome]